MGRIALSSLVVAAALGAFSPSRASAAELHVKDVTVSFVPDGSGGTIVVGTVKIAGNTKSLAGISVEGELWIDVGMGDMYYVSGTTDRRGVVTFTHSYSYAVPPGEWAQLCVTGVARAGDTYDASRNVETCGTGTN